MIPASRRAWPGQFFGYLTQTPAEEVPFEVVVELQEHLQASGFSAQELVHRIVMHPQFRAVAADDPDHRVAGLKTVRPEQYARAVEDLTGYRWYADADPTWCDDPANADVARFGSQCWGVVDLSTSDVFGFRAMAGGVDGKVIVRPTHGPTPTKTLTMAILAADAAGWVVDTDLVRARAGRRPPRPGGSDTTDETAIRDQLAWLHARILGRRVDRDGAEVTALHQLFEVGLDSRGDPAGAWKVVLTAMLQDPRMMFW